MAKNRARAGKLILTKIAISRIVQRWRKQPRGRARSVCNVSTWLGEPVKASSVRVNEFNLPFYWALPCAHGHAARRAQHPLCERSQRAIGRFLFTKPLGLNPNLIELNELKTRVSFFLKLDNGKYCP